MAPKLGAVFWGNFFARVTDQTEVQLQQKLAEMKADLGAHDSDIALYHENCRVAEKALRGHGFRMPTAGDRRAICMWCWSSCTCNSAHLQGHLVMCDRCPESVKCLYRKAAITGKSAKSIFGAHQLKSARVAQEAVERQEMLHSPPRPTVTEQAEPATEVQPRSKRLCVALPYVAAPSLLLREGSKQKIISSIQSDAEALRDPTQWRHWGEICERRGIAWAEDHTNDFDLADNL